MTDCNRYLPIYDFMLEKLKLSGIQLLVYAVVYSFCKSGDGEFRGSLEYLAKRSAASTVSVRNALKDLTEKELLIKTCGDKYAHKCYRINYDTLTDKTDDHIVENAKETSPSCQIFDTQNDGNEGENFFTLREKKFSPEEKEIFPNKKDDNKEINTTTATTTTVRVSAEERAELVERKRINESVISLCERKMMQYQSSPKHRAIYNVFQNKLDSAIAESLKIELAEGLGGKIPPDSNYFETFGRYGDGENVLLSKSQYEYLYVWLGEEILSDYINRLTMFMQKKPKAEIHSHFHTIKKWAEEDFTLK